jgi:hypothetical protein
VRLPQSIRRSREPIEYDLSNPRHLRSVYKQVLRANKLVEVWDDLFLPAYVRAAWKPSLQRRRVSQP